MSESPQQQRLYLLFAVIGLVVGLVGGFLVDEARGAPAHRPTGTAAAGVDLPNAGTLSRLVAQELICRDVPPEYPGCTPAQARAREAHTRRMTRRHYAASRWGQTHHEFRGLHRRADRRLRRLYHRAVVRYLAQRAKTTASAQAMSPRFRTWRAFKRHTSCSGVFGWSSAMPYAWCQIGSAFSDWDEAARDTRRMTLKCDGLVLAAAAGGAAIAGWSGVAIAPAAVAAGGGTAVGCAVETIYNQLWSW